MYVTELGEIVWSVSFCSFVFYKTLLNTASSLFNDEVGSETFVLSALQNQELNPCQTSCFQTVQSINFCSLVLFPLFRQFLLPLYSLSSVCCHVIVCVLWCVN